MPRWSPKSGFPKPKQVLLAKVPSFSNPKTTYDVTLIHDPGGPVVRCACNALRYPCRHLLLIAHGLRPFLIYLYDRNEALARTPDPTNTQQDALRVQAEILNHLGLILPSPTKKTEKLPAKENPEELPAPVEADRFSKLLMD